jgi:hypothetical protein
LSGETVEITDWLRGGSCDLNNGSCKSSGVACACSNIAEEGRSESKPGVAGDAVAGVPGLDGSYAELAAVMGVGEPTAVEGPLEDDESAPEIGAAATGNAIADAPATARLAAFGSSWDTVSTGTALGDTVSALVWARGPINNAANGVAVFSFTLTAASKKAALKLAALKPNAALIFAFAWPFKSGEALGN